MTSPAGAPEGGVGEDQRSLLSRPYVSFGLSGTPSPLYIQEVSRRNSIDKSEVETAPLVSHCLAKAVMELPRFEITHSDRAPGTAAVTLKHITQRHIQPPWAPIPGPEHPNSETSSI